MVPCCGTRYHGGGVQKIPCCPRLPILTLAFVSVTPEQKGKLIKLLLGFHSKPPTFGSLTAPWLKQWLLFTIAPALGALFFFAGWPGVLWLMVGMWLGMVSRDLGSIRHTLRVWPIYNRVIAWERVEQLDKELNSIPASDR
jgi:hypothetical protein